MKGALSAVGVVDTERATEVQDMAPKRVSRRVVTGRSH